MPSRPLAAPAAGAGAITTIQVSPAVVPLSQHEPLSAAGSTAAHPQAAAASTRPCSAYYGQKKATSMPKAYGRTLTWAPCGYTPAQLRDAYGATKSGLTGTGTSVAILSEADDSNALSDANRWARQQHVPPFAAGQFKSYIAPNSAAGSIFENTMDVEAVHGMAPAARVAFVVGNGQVTGDVLLDALNTVVQHRLADVVTTSWFEGYEKSTGNPFLPTVTASMIASWEGVLKRAAAEGITVNAASGDSSSLLGLQYPASDPWVTSVGGTSLAIGATGNYLWETGWDTDETTMAANGRSWSPAPPGTPNGGSTGGVSQKFAEPAYQDGVVSGNTRDGKRMRAVPDVSALGDWNLGYQMGVTSYTPQGAPEFEDVVNGGTSLSAPLLAGFEADLIQGRGGKRLGFANPLLYRAARSAAFHDVTATPQGRGYTEAVVSNEAGVGPTYDVLSTMGQCATKTAKAMSCGPGYDMVTGLGSPGPAFFRSFGSRPK